MPDPNKPIQRKVKLPYSFNITFDEQKKQEYTTRPRILARGKTNLRNYQSTSCVIIPNTSSKPSANVCVSPTSTFCDTIEFKGMNLAKSSSTKALIPTSNPSLFNFASSNYYMNATSQRRVSQSPDNNSEAEEDPRKSLPGLNSSLPNSGRMLESKP